MPRRVSIRAPRFHAARPDRACTSLDALDECFNPRAALSRGATCRDAEFAVDDLAHMFQSARRAFTRRDCGASLYLRRKGLLALYRETINFRRTRSS